LNSVLIKPSHRIPCLINKFKRPFIKLTLTPIEFIFDRTTILKRKEKNNLKNVSYLSPCLSDRVFNEIAKAFLFSFLHFIPLT